MGLFDKFSISRAISTIISTPAPNTERAAAVSRLRAIGDNLVVPVSTQLTYPQIELHLPHEARVLGVVDAEIRPLLKIVQPEVPEELAKLWKPRPLVPEARMGPMLRNARTNSMWAAA